MKKKTKCPLCGELGCEKWLCESVVRFHGVYTKEGLEVTEAGKILYKKLKHGKKVTQ